MSTRPHRPTVAAVIPTHDRPRSLSRVLEQLASAAVDEIVIVDNGSSVDLGPIATRFSARLIRLPVNAGILARNVGAEVADAELLLMLDDDSYPLDGSVEHMVKLFAHSPGLACVGGKVIDVDARDAKVLRSGDEVGSFHWFSTFGRAATSRDGEDGIPTFLAAEGACMIRRSAHREVDGFFAPYFRELAELDLATRLIAGGWEVRYLPSAAFRHIHSGEWRINPALHLRLRVRNQVWYFVRHFSYARGLPRILAYLAFDLIDCLYRGHPASWTRGVADALRGMSAVRQTRVPVDPALIDSMTRTRGRAHIALLRHAATARASRLRRQPSRTS